MKLNNKIIALIILVTMALSYFPISSLPIYATDINMPKITVIQAEDASIIANQAQVKNGYIEMKQGANSAGTILETKDTYTIPAGSYKVLSYVRLNGTPIADDILKFDISYNNTSEGSSQITKSLFKNDGSFERIETSFTLTQNLTGAKFRMYYHANADVDLDKFEIFKTDVQYTELDAGSGALGTLLTEEKVGSEVKTGMISGVGIRVDKTSSQTQKQATFGWGGNLTAGNYKMIVRMKLIEGTGNPSNVVAMANTNSSKGQSAIVNLKESDFPALDTFYDIVVPLDFTDGDRTSIEPYIWKLNPTDAAPTTYLIDSVTFVDADFDSALITDPPVLTNDISMPKIAVIQAEDASIIANQAQVKNGYIEMKQGANSAGTILETKDTYTIPAGSYKVLSYVRLNGTPIADDILKFDISYNNTSEGSSQITKSLFKNDGSFERIETSFTITQNLTGAKFRMYNYANADVDLDKFEIFKTDVQYTELDAGSGALGTLLTEEKVGSEVKTGMISGVGIRVDKASSQTQRQATFGWGGNLAAGNYKMIVRMKLIEGTGNPDNVVAMANTNSSKGQSAIVNLKESDFPALDTFYDIVVPLDFADGDRTSIEPYIWKLNPDVNSTTYLIDSVTFVDADFDSTLITDPPVLTNDIPMPKIAVIQAEDANLMANLSQVKSGYIQMKQGVNSAGTTLETKDTYTIPAGNYKVVSYVRLNGTPIAGSILTFDILDNNTSIIGTAIVSSQFKNDGSFERIETSFSLTQQLTGAKFRMYYHANADVDLDKFEIFKTDVQYTELDAGSGALGTLLTEEKVGSEVKTGMISGVGIRVDKTSSQTQRQATFGWGGNLAAGNYKMIVRMKLIEGTGNPSNVVAMANTNSSKGQSAVVNLKESDFPALDTFYDIVVPLDFTDGDRTSIEPYIWKLNPTDAAPTTYLIDSVTFVDADFDSVLITPYVPPVTPPQPPVQPTVQPPASNLPNDVISQNAVDIAGVGGTVLNNAVQCDPKANTAGVAAETKKVPIVAGKYRVAVLASLLKDGTGNVFEIALIDTNGKEIAKKTISAADLSTEIQPVSVSFDIASDVVASIRVKNLNKVGFKVTQINGYQAINNGVVHYGAKNDTRANSGVERTENEDGTITSPQTSKPGHSVIAKTLTNLAPGKNLFLFKVRQLSQTSGATNITNIDFAANKVGGVSARYQLKTVTIADFESINNWTVIPIEFDTNEWLRNVEVAMYNYGNASWQIESIEVLDPVAAKAYWSALPPKPILNIATQNTEGSQVGLKTPSGLILASGMGSGYAIYGNLIKSIEPGKYKAVYYMKIYSKNGNPNTTIATFDLYGKYVNKSEREVQFTTPIRESSFPKVDTYYAIEIPFTIDVAFKDVEARFFYNDNEISTKINRNMVLQQAITTPAVIQIPDEKFQRPKDVTPVNSAIIPFATGSIVFNSEKSGHTVDGHIEFKKATDLSGGIKKLKDDIYLTNGSKTVRIYYRTPTVAVGGSYAFANFTVTQGYFPIKTFSITGNSVSGYVNRSYVAEATFNADDNMPINIKMNWSGNNDLIIDKIVFKNNDASDAKEIAINTKSSGGNYIATIDKTQLTNVSAVDKFVMSMNGITLKIPTTEIIGWLANNEKVEVVVSEPNVKKAQVLQNMADNYRNKVNTIKLYDISVKVYNGKTAIVKKAIANTYTVTIQYPPKLVKGSNAKNLMGLCSFLGDSARVGALNSNLNAETSTITFTTFTLGTFYVGITDLSK